MSNGIKPANDMSENEKLASIQSFLSTETGLEDAIALLSARKVSFATTETELKLIKIKLADLKAELAKVRARLIAFQAGDLTMRPPSPQVLQEIQSHAATLDRMIVQAETADTIVAAAVLLAQAWAETQTT